MPTKKEEIASELRKLLNTNIRFEKLSIHELEELKESIDKFTSSTVENLTKTQPRENIAAENMGPLGLGVMPALSKAFQQALNDVAPNIRTRIKELIDEALGGAQDVRQTR
ncbi:MAG: hypothetical protein QW304_07910 [Thermoproteota archaeon]